MGPRTVLGKCRFLLLLLAMFPAFAAGTGTVPVPTAESVPVESVQAGAARSATAPTATDRPGRDVRGTPSSAEAVDSLLDRIEACGDLGENGPGERAFFALLAATASRYGVEFAYRDADLLRNEHSFSRTAVLRLQGRTEDTVAFAVPVNPAGAGRDPGLGLAIALAAFEREALRWRGSPEGTLQGTMSGKPEKRGLSVDFVFMGAEYGDPLLGEDSVLSTGTRMYLASIPVGRNTTIVYLDFPFSSPGLKLSHYGRKIVSPYWLFSRGIDALAGAGFGVTHEAGLSQFYRTGLVEKRCLASWSLERGIPAIQVSSVDTGRQRSGREKANAVPARSDSSPLGTRAFASAVMDFTGRFLDVNEPALPEIWDRHYFVFDLPGRTVVLKESRFLVAILAVCGFISLSLIFVSLFARKTLFGFVQGFLHSLKSLFVTYAVCFGILVGLAALTGFSLGLRGSVEAQAGNPFPYIVARALLFGAAFVFLFMLALRHKALPMTISFYGGGAVILLMVDIFVFSGIDLSYAFFFLWAFVACVISLYFRKKAIAVLSLVMTFLPLVSLFALVSGRGGSLLSTLFTKVDFPEIAACAFIFMPILLLACRVFFLFVRLEKPPAHRNIVVAGLGLVGLVAVYCLFSLSFVPYGNSRPMPVSVQTVSDWSKGVQTTEIRMPFAMRKAWIEFDGQRSGLDSRKLVMPGSLDPEFAPSHSVATDGFLSRKRISLKLDAPLGAERIKFGLELPGSSAIFDCNYPFIAGIRGDSAEILVGRDPVLPLTIEMTVSSDFAANATVEYLGRKDGIAVSPAISLERASRTDIDRFELE